MGLTPEIVAALGPPLAVIVWLVLSLRKSPDAPPIASELSAIRRDLADARERLARVEGMLSKGDG